MSLSTLGAQLAALNGSGNGGSTRTGGGGGGGGNGNGGIMVPGSKRHDENIGKGINYSSQYGMHQNQRHSGGGGGGNNTKFKPSLLAVTSRDAADVPLRTLHEYAIQSIDILLVSHNYPSNLLRTIRKELIVPNLNMNNNSQHHNQHNNHNNHSRTESSSPRKLIPTALILFSTYLVVDHNNNNNNNNDSNTTIVHHTLNILEFMIRQYDLHVRYSNELLWVFLPYMDHHDPIRLNHPVCIPQQQQHHHHRQHQNNNNHHNVITTTLSNLFFRCLELIDLSGTSGNNIVQSYVWLRPYSQLVRPNVDQNHRNPNNNNNKNQNSSRMMMNQNQQPYYNIPSHTFVARHSIQSVHILRTICNIVTTMGTTIYQSEQQEQVQLSGTNNKKEEDRTTVNVRNGLAYPFSYTMALVTEGIQYLGTVRNTGTKFDTTHIEAIVRTLLPTLFLSFNQITTVTSTGGGGSGGNCCCCPHFTTWGYMIVSILTETMDVTPHLLSAITTKIYKGNGSHSTSTVAMTTATTVDAMTTILSLLLPQNKKYPTVVTTSNKFLSGPFLPSEIIHDEMEEDEEEQQQQTIVGIPLVKQQKSDDTSKIQLLGCMIPEPLWNAILLSHDEKNHNNKMAMSSSLSQCLGYLYEDCQLIIEPFLGGLLYKCIHYNQQYLYIQTTTTTKDATVPPLMTNPTVALNLFRSLFMEPKLATLYKSLDITTSLTMYIVMLYCSGGGNNGNGNTSVSNISTSKDEEEKDPESTSTKKKTEHHYIDLQYARSLLQIIRPFDSFTFEYGIALAIKYNQDENDTIQHSHTGSSSTSVGVFTKRAKELLHGILEVVGKEDDDMEIDSKTPNDKDNDDDEGYDDDDDNDYEPFVADLWKLLPIGVALDHAQTMVRLKAIQRLIVVNTTKPTPINDKDVVDGINNPSTASVRSPTVLLESLLRRWGYDSHRTVSLAACKALTKLFQTFHFASIHHTGGDNKDEFDIANNVLNGGNVRSIVEMALTGCYRALAGQSTSNMLTTARGEQRQLLCYSMEALAYIAQAIAKLGIPDLMDCWQVCIEFIVAHLSTGTDDDDDVDISNCAAKAFYIAFDVIKSNIDNSKSTEAVISLTQRVPFLTRLETSFTKCIGLQDQREVEISLRMRCFWVVTKSIMDQQNEQTSSKAKKTMKSNHVPIYLFPLCIGATLCSFNLNDIKLSKMEARVVLSCIELSLTKETMNNEEVPILLVKLASIVSEDIYVDIAVPISKLILKNVTTNGSTKANVSPYVILMEAVLRPSTVHTEKLRLLQLTKQYFGSEAPPSHLLVPCIALLDDPHEEVRAGTIQFFEDLNNALSSTDVVGPGSDCMSIVCRTVAEMKSSAIIGGSSFLVNFLSQCIKNSANMSISVVQENLISLCFCTSFSFGLNSSDKVIPKNCWISPLAATGGSFSAAKVLNAMEASGEESFPLLLRWKCAGKLFISNALHTDEFASISPTILECAIRMIKGVIIADPQVIITSAPRAGGGRARSYSVGKMEGATVLFPYPRDMYETLAEVLTNAAADHNAAMILAQMAAKYILSSKSWGDEIFKKLPNTARKLVASSIVRYLSSDPDDVPDNIVVSLPFEASDVYDLLFSMKESLDLSHESMLLDYIQSNTSIIARADKCSPLLCILFDHLRILFRNPEDDSALVNYSRQSIIVTLAGLLNAAFKDSKPKDLKAKMVDNWFETLLSIVEDEKVAESREISLVRARFSALSLYLTLCAHYPKQGIPNLIRVTISAISRKSTTNDQNQTSRVLSMVIPTFWKYAAECGYSVTNLLNPLVKLANSFDGDIERRALYKSFTDVLIVDATNDESANMDSMAKIACVGAIQAIYLISEANKLQGKLVENDHIVFACELTKHVPGQSQMTTLLLLLHYIKGFLGIIRSESSHSELSDLLAAGKEMIPSVQEVAELSNANLQLAQGRRILLSATRSIVNVFNECLMTDSILRFIKRGEDTAALQLWQELLIVQSVARADTIESDTEEDIDVVVSLLSESHEYLQSVLPSPVFLSSVSSLISDDCTPALSSRALRLVADKVTVLDRASHEVALFVDLIPSVLSLLDKPFNMKEDELILCQSGLVAIEHIARAYKSRIGEVSESHRKAAKQYFNSSLKFCATTLQQCTDSLHTQADNMSVTLDNIICSSALCAATLVRAIGANSLPLLPTLMKPLITSLESANSFIATNSDPENEEVTSKNMVQLSIVRAITSFVDSIPQFLPPYMTLLLTSSCLLSSALRDVTSTGDIPVRAAVFGLDASLSSKIPFRLLVPVLTKAMANNEGSVELRTLFSILTLSLKNSSSSDVATQRNIIMYAVKQTMERDLPWSDRLRVMESTADAFDELILKVSEIQLRRIYTSLKEWKGELQTDEFAKGANKRFAFWLLSARLSKELRSIFLPCLDMVFDDAIQELEYAVQFLCKKGPLEKTASGQKRRRLEDSTTSSAGDVEAMRILTPLLCCLEESLKSDAKEDVNWVKAEENRKYEMLLEPLGKLLLSRIPADFPAPEGVTNAFQYIVEGYGLEVGSVVGCLNALALAGGEENLWKPLNHAVLQACGDETRVECRRAGLACLLSLMKTLGEEYMVLLPEILPILAELLEDTNDEVAGLAKDVVTHAEELTGENLEESLR